jgi:hypothetical protein
VKKKTVAIKWSPGTQVLIGLPDLKPGEAVILEGLGFAFHGAYYIASVTHAISDGGYVTTFNAERSASDHADENSSRHGHQRIGLMVGVIKELNLKAEEILVRFPWSESKMPDHWIRVPGQGTLANHASWVAPVEGDEVLIAFLPGDMRWPVLLGGLYDGDDIPPESESETFETREVAIKFAVSNPRK